ncbi:RNA polymerase sigma factor [Steroidobacter sp.]|uniref:RNA polymerase sigma factor n=1 Tax=Steroidobacter sp. TaxID=1978227 RepID=UPI001A6430E1|nr:sigma-70 family RNA polymerase sigma factor [Steroidobacter sp.]MBL8267541.1 sigma-70 family RNA polymerase sigma factor [Steroidobacter sp.]
MQEIVSLFGKMRRLLMSRGRTADDAEDLMQEAFLRLQVYSRDHAVQHTEAFVVRTVLNLSAEMGRRSRRFQSSDATETLVAVDPAPLPDEVLAGQQRLLRLKAGLQQLNPRPRQVFLLNRVEGYSYVQIAERLGISVSMVEKHIARASFFLADWMARYRE